MATELVDVAEQLASCFPSREHAYALLARTKGVDLHNLPSYESIPPIGFWQRVVDELSKRGPRAVATLLAQAAKEFPANSVFARYRDEESEAPETVAETESRWVLTIEGTLDEFDAERLQSVIAQLRKISGDASLTIQSIERGSIRLTLGGGEESSNVMKSLYDRGQLTIIDGLPVLDLEVIDDASGSAPVETTTNDEEAQDRPLQVFVSYAHEDEEFRQELDAHLSILKRQDVLAVWSDRVIPPGSEWEPQIDDNLESADIILFLVSAYFAASEYCYANEMSRALEMHEAKQAVVIPLLVRPVDWSCTPFAKLAVLPSNAQPVTGWADRHEAWTAIATDIRKTAERINGNRKPR